MWICAASAGFVLIFTPRGDGIVGSQTLTLTQSYPVSCYSMKCPTFHGLSSILHLYSKL